MWRGIARFMGLLAWVCSAHAQAAWLQPKGKMLIISSLSDYRSVARFDALGFRGAERAYRKQELSLYGVYGLMDGLTLGVQPSFYRLHVRSAATSARQSMNGLSYIELFARTRILAGDFWILSAQTLVKLPGPRAVDGEPLLENASRDVEARLLFGHSGRFARQLLNLEYFSSIEAGYRARDRQAADQWRADATFGFRPSQKYQIILQGFNTISLKSPDGSDPTAYDLYKAQISVVRDLPHGMALQAGGFTEYAGRNTGAGNALFMAVWSRF